MAKRKATFTAADREAQRLRQKLETVADIANRYPTGPPKDITPVGKVAVGDNTFPGTGLIRCGICDEPVNTHSLTKDCRRDKTG